jgi:exodeoxyribonuclease VII small subunit
MSARGKRGDEKAPEPTFEEALSRLEEIVGDLEGGEVELDRGLELFEEGVKLSRRCHEMLSAAEQRIQRLVREEEGGLTLELFPRESDSA